MSNMTLFQRLTELFTKNNEIAQLNRRLANTIKSRECVLAELSRVQGLYMDLVREHHHATVLTLEIHREVQGLLDEGVIDDHDNILSITDSQMSLRECDHKLKWLPCSEEQAFRLYEQTGYIHPGKDLK